MDEILAGEEELVPSSGFTALVMDRVRGEADAPAPIPFPWKRAVPGMVLAVAVFAWVAVEFARSVARATPTLTLPSIHLPAAASYPLQQTGWVVAALAVSLVSWMVARRVAR
jgi:hypothetical protein